MKASKDCGIDCDKHCDNCSLRSYQSREALQKDVESLEKLLQDILNLCEISEYDIYEDQNEIYALFDVLSDEINIRDTMLKATCKRCISRQGNNCDCCAIGKEINEQK